MKNITSQVELEEICGRVVPKDAWRFGKAIEAAQDYSKLEGRHTILYNKGRYFETSIHDHKLLVSISKAIKSKIQYKTMIADSWRKLEAFVKAMNKRGYYVAITIDWI